MILWVWHDEAFVPIAGFSRLTPLQFDPRQVQNRELLRQEKPL